MWHIQYEIAGKPVTEKFHGLDDAFRLLALLALLSDVSGVRAWRK